MKLPALLEQLYDSLELGPPPPLEKGSYELTFAAESPITLRPLDPGISLYAPLGPLQKQKKEDLFIYLSKANFLGQGTGKSCIGLDPQEKFLTLSLLFPYDMNYKTFKETLEDFANYADFWKAELVRYLAASEEQIF